MPVKLILNKLSISIYRSDWIAEDFSSKFVEKLNQENTIPEFTISYNCPSFSDEKLADMLNTWSSYTSIQVIHRASSDFLNDSYKIFPNLKGASIILDWRRFVFETPEETDSDMWQIFQNFEPSESNLVELRCRDAYVMLVIGGTK